MATKTFAISADSIVVQNPSGGSLGAGKDYHLWAGYSSSYLSRILLQFTCDFTGMTAISSAVLYLRTTRASDGTLGGYARGTHGSYASGTLYAERNTTSWAEGSYGNDEVWYLGNTVNWSNKPATTTTGRGTFTPTRSSRPSSPTNDTIDITSVVRAWAPSATVTGGGDASNYGLTLRMASETSGNFTEYYSREAVGNVSSAVAAYIVVTYSTTNTAPTATPSNPAGSALATIVNLNDVQAWDNTGQYARARLSWTYTAGTPTYSQGAWRARLYADAAKATAVYDSGWVTDATYGTATSHDLPSSTAVPSYIPNGSAAWQSTYTGLVNGSAYYWTATVRDTTGAESSESAATAFKVRWAQATYQYGTTTFASSSQWAFSSSPIATNTQSAFLFRTATGTAGTGASSWSSSVGTLAIPTGGTPYINILARLATNTSGTNPTLGTMTFSYIPAATTPDHWTASGASLSFDLTNRRFGTKSARVSITGSADAFAAPYRSTTWDDIPVLPNTTYTFSGYVKTPGGALTGANTLGLRVYAATPGTATVASTQLLASSTTTTNTLTATGASEGWLRLSTSVTTDGVTTSIRPVLYYTNTAAASGDYFLADGMIFEEGTVVRSWTPNLVSASGIVDSGGINIDKSVGGTLRLRGSAGGSRDVVQLGANGLSFGGDTSPVNLSSGTALRLSTDNSFDVVGSLTVGGTAAAGTATPGLTIGGTVTAIGSTIRADGHGVATYDKGGSADVTTITTAATYYALTNAEVSFTPAYVGQRWLITMTAYGSLNTTVIQNAFVESRITDSSNTQIVSLGFSRFENFGTSGRGSAVAFTKVWVADAVAVRKFKLYGTAQTTNGLVLSLGYTQMSAIPLP